MSDTTRFTSRSCALRAMAFTLLLALAVRFLETPQPQRTSFLLQSVVPTISIFL